MEPVWDTVTVDGAASRLSIKTPPVMSAVRPTSIAVNVPSAGSNWLNVTVCCQLSGVSPIVWYCFIVVWFGWFMNNTVAARHHLRNDHAPTPQDIQVMAACRGAIAAGGGAGGRTFTGVAPSP